MLNNISSYLRGLTVLPNLKTLFSWLVLSSLPGKISPNYQIFHPPRMGLIGKRWLSVASHPA